MLSRQRHTIAALSTALDSLRAKIHHFADTADEEQLREVAQLIDRLSISNNGPFRLLDLPYELLEYTAERYFNRKEAVPILPANRVFSELFANRVWKSIGFDGMMVDGCYVPQNVLRKNALRVRNFGLWSIEPDSFVSDYFRYATSIVFELKDGMEKMFTLHLEQMKCLRRVTLAINDMPSSVIDTAAKWIDGNHFSGRVQQIVISAAYSSDSQQSNHILASLMDKIEFKKRIRVICTSLQPFPASIVQFMPAALTQLFIAQMIPTNCHGEINKQVFGTDPVSIFLHLRALSVQVCCSNSSLYDFQSFVPERFPVLSNFVLGVPEQCCNGDADSPLTTMFSNKQWPSIADVGLIGDNTAVPGIGRLLSKAMPALRSCTFQNIAEVDISSDLDKHLTISELYSANTTLEVSRLRGKLACLVLLQLNSVHIDSNYLQFIASCKRLTEIKLVDCNATKDAIAAVYKYPCNSVRKVIVSEGSGELFTDHLAHLLPAFPNISVLNLTEVQRSKRMNFMLKCPNVKILT
ncbi:hypothetical protein GQ42DRAFT_154648 [Ramicandelaber brevisporus]|nr:hypothetical protein GQ42DRAFT_154648 [Ramicandelaber brevisporus]